MRRTAAVLLALAAAAGGCGDDTEQIVALDGEPPYVNSLVVEDDGSFLLTTNRGFWRIRPGGGGAERLRSQVTAGRRSSPVGDFLEIDRVRGGELLGSGHPDDEQALPRYLGLIRSADEGRTWTVVAKLGEADLHQIRRVGGRLYAFDAVTGAILISGDEGRTWAERYTPRELIVDFAVDPGRPATIVVSTEDELFRSRNGGESWRPVGRAPSARLDWPARGVFMRADRDGAFSVSADGGQTWRRRGALGGEPYEVVAEGTRRAFVALRDGTILETSDGGRSFHARFEP